jgi:hypothetical protein
MADTESELARLRADGVGPDRLIDVSCFFSHFSSTPEQRRPFARRIQAAGFDDIGCDEEVTGDGHWHHWSHSPAIGSSVGSPSPPRARPVLSGRRERADQTDVALRPREALRAAALADDFRELTA